MNPQLLQILIFLLRIRISKGQMQQHACIIQRSSSETAKILRRTYLIMPVFQQYCSLLTNSFTENKLCSTIKFPLTIFRKLQIIFLIKHVWQVLKIGLNELPSALQLIHQILLFKFSRDLSKFLRHLKEYVFFA